MKLLIYMIHTTHVYIVGLYHCWLHDMVFISVNFTGIHHKRIVKCWQHEDNLWVCCQPCLCWFCTCRQAYCCWHWMSGRMTQYLFLKWHCWYLYTRLFKSVEFGNGSRISNKKFVILEFKYLQNKKLRKQAVKSTRIKKSYRTYWLFSFHSAN